MKKHPLAAMLTAAMLCITMLSSAIHAAAFSYVSTCSYLYDQLDSNAQAFYDGLYAACLEIDQSSKTYESTPRVKYSGLSDEQMCDTIILFMYGHPEFFWLSNYYNYGYSGRSSYATIDVYEPYQSGSARAEARQEIDSIAEDYIQAAAKYSTDYDRARYLATQLRSDVTYQSGDLDQTMASTFLQKATVCAGFTKAYQMLANAVGVETISVLSPGHGWNYSKIGGKWYHVDVTNRIFLASDSEIAAWDKKAGEYSGYDYDGNAITYMMHEITCMYYSTDLYPACPDSYNGASAPVELQPLTESTAETTSTTTTTTTTTTTATTTETETTLPETTTTLPETTTLPAVTTTETTTTETTAAPTEAPSDPLPPQGASRTGLSITTSPKHGILYCFAEDGTPFDINDFINVKCTLTYSDGTVIELDHYPDAAIYGSDFLVEFSSESPQALYEAQSDGSSLVQDSTLSYSAFGASGSGYMTVWIGQYGDCDLDGTVSAADASHILVYAAMSGLDQEYDFPVPDDIPQEFAQFLTGAASPDQINSTCASELLFYVAQNGLK